jgi:hypothetical protein
MFGKREGGGRRFGKRVDIPLPALLITMSDRHPAVLVDISLTGALLNAKDPPTKGTEIFLQVGCLDVYAKVIWKSGERCGLKFENPIRPWDVEQLRSEACSAQKAKLSAAEKGGADDWATGVAR